MVKFEEICCHQGLRYTHHMENNRNVEIFYQVMLVFSQPMPGRMVASSIIFFMRLKTFLAKSIHHTNKKRILQRKEIEVEEENGRKSVYMLRMRVKGYFTLSMFVFKA